MTTDKHNPASGNLDDEMDRVEAHINSQQVREERARNRGTRGYVRPKNASTMILLDGPVDDPLVLMGKRNKKLKFMPGALVFPGGSVDRFDGSVPSVTELTQQTSNRLKVSMRGRPTDRGARALGMAAIREVAEESGIMVGKSGDLSTDHDHWKEFRQAGIVPSLSGLRLFARAITPPGMDRRFDTWFFIAHASEVGFTPAGGFSPDGELEDLQWIKPEKAITESTREITRVMLVELIRRLREDRELSDAYPAPYYHTVGNRFHKTMI
ncbi:MAG: NUDIX domain-containing protein [Pseudomonadota bacterium]